jgi:hypothetical protein
MTDTIDRIEDLFKDNSMPPMILIDGDWGSGKTYFINHKLIPHFKKKSEKVVFFSLYGVADLNDFRDKLLSAYALDNKDASSGFKNLSTIFTKIGSTFGESNASNIGAIASSLTGMIKHAALGRIKDFTLILDDLERIADDKLTGLLLGECIELAENNQIKVIVAANAKQITTKTTKTTETTETTNPMLEKAFIDIISYKTSPEDMVNIAIEGIELFEQNITNIRNEVIRLGYTNLRVLKRALFRLKPVLQKIKESDEIIKEPSAKIATSTILAICFAYYEKHYTKQEIRKKEGQHRSIKGKDMVEPSEKEEELSKIFSTVQRTTNAINYCFGEKLKINIINDLNLPKKKDPLNSMITGNYIYLSEDEFAQGMILLKRFIISKETVNFEQWGKACGMLLYFSQFNYIDDTQESIWVKINKFKEIIDFAPNSGNTRWINSIENAKLKDLLLKESTCVTNKSDDMAIKAFKDVMVHSWREALETETHSFLSDQVLSFTDSDFLNQCIENWDAIDIREFDMVLGERYKHLTSNSYEQEIINLEGIIEMLEEKLLRMQSSFKKGELTYLLNTSGKTLKHLIDIQAKNSRD